MYTFSIFASLPLVDSKRNRERERASKRERERERASERERERAKSKSLTIIMNLSIY
jgi:hypothetical protein